MRHGIRIALLSVVLASRALAQSPSPAHPSVPLPPSVDRVLRDYERAWRAADVAALVALFAEDGFVLQSGRPPARGHAAIAEAYRGQGGGALRLRALAFATADSIGYVIGAYGYEPDAADMGKFTLSLRRSPDGRWLIFSDMDNGSRPPPPEDAREGGHSKTE